MVEQTPGLLCGIKKQKEDSDKTKGEETRKKNIRLSYCQSLGPMRTKSID